MTSYSDFITGTRYGDLPGKGEANPNIVYNSLVNFWIYDTMRRK
jgi:hypothetical protein